MLVVLYDRKEERPAHRVNERNKDNGIMDCLLYYASKGHRVIFCTHDKRFSTRAQVSIFLHPPCPFQGQWLKYNSQCAFSEVDCQNIETAILVLLCFSLVA